MKCTRFENNYSSCTGRRVGALKIYVAAMKALRKKERGE
jgi:hypothetical protein